MFIKVRIIDNASVLNIQSSGKVHGSDLKKKHDTANMKRNRT